MKHGTHCHCMVCTIGKKVGMIRGKEHSDHHKHNHNNHNHHDKCEHCGHEHKADSSCACECK